MQGILLIQQTFLSACCVPDTVLGAKDTTVNKQRFTEYIFLNPQFPNKEGIFGALNQIMVGNVELNKSEWISLLWD